MQESPAEPGFLFREHIQQKCEAVLRRINGTALKRVAFNGIQATRFKLLFYACLYPIEAGLEISPVD